MPAHGRLYSVSFENVAVTASQDLFEVTPADDKPVRLHSISISQSSDAGDAAAELLRLAVIRGHTTGGSGGSTPTPRPLNRSDAAAGFAAETNNTTIASTGTTHQLDAFTLNVQSGGYPIIYTPEMRPEASQADTTIVVRLMAAPADSLTMSGTIIVEELG